MESRLPISPAVAAAEAEYTEQEGETRVKPAKMEPMSEIEGRRAHWLQGSTGTGWTSNLLGHALQKPPSLPPPPSSALIPLFPRQTCIPSARVQKSNKDCCHFVNIWCLGKRRHRGAWTVPYLVLGLQLGFAKDLEK